jgi:hypothetical protein
MAAEIAPSSFYISDRKVDASDGATTRTARYRTDPPGFVPLRVGY